MTSGMRKSMDKKNKTKFLYRLVGNRAVPVKVESFTGKQAHIVKRVSGEYRLDTVSRLDLFKTPEAALRAAIPFDGYAVDDDEKVVPVKVQRTENGLIAIDPEGNRHRRFTCFETRRQAVKAARVVLKSRLLRLRKDARRTQKVIAQVSKMLAATK